MAAAARFHAFTESDVDALHVQLIKLSLHALRDGRNGPETRTEIVGWVMEEGMRPFSFDACCVFIGMNAERMRSAVLWLVKKGERGTV